MKVRLRALLSVKKPHSHSEEPYILSCMAFSSIHGALLSVYKALLSVFGAPLCEYMALLSV